MKYIKLLFAVVSVITVFTFSQCKKNKDDEPQLPPETTTGAMTFGCKVNGKVFIPKDGNGRPGLVAQYVNLGSGQGGGWYLNIPAYNYPNNEGIGIETDSLLLITGMTYEFKKQKKGHPLAWYEIIKNGSTEIYGKLDTNTGTLFVTKHDQSSRILSGRFEFIGTKISLGETTVVTEGRFDIRY